MSSISNPFFFDPGPGPGSAHHPHQSICSAATAGQGHSFTGFGDTKQQQFAGAQRQQQVDGQAEEERGAVDAGGDKRYRQRQQGSCCVANPFTEEGSCQLESRMSQSMMDSLLSVCSSAEYPAFLSPSTSNSICIPFAAKDDAAGPVAGTAHASTTYASYSKLLQDSGYRSATSNSALEEELAAVEQQRKAEREQRRQQRQQQRKQQQQQRRVGGGGDGGRNGSGILDGNGSAVPAFLRRTCSSAASGFSAAIRPPTWIGGILPVPLPATLSTSFAQKQQRRNFGGPRRTRSVGGNSNRSLAAAAASSIQLPPSFLYSTGWMVEADLSDDSPDKAGTGSGATTEKDDCSVELSGHRQLGILRLQELLLSRFCFIPGMRTAAGHPVITFPDCRSGIGFEDYQLLLDYLLQTQRDEELPSTSSQQQPPALEWVLVVDRRQDRWSSVRMLLAFLLSYFPEPIHLVLLLKPEGVLQRAIEYGGYRTLLDGCEDKLRVLICHNCAELQEYLDADSLTMDLGGTVRHNHQEWVAHRIDIERMKCSARMIAESLSEFGRCLRETELPNDVHSTERILDLQQQERDAIKEDFRISIRKGMQLLQQVRQIDQHALGEQLSPSRLQNVTAIERMIAQLQDTEKSFDTFWQKHRHRLLGCLQLRRFEDEFRKLQSSFAKHMFRLEEHREVGNSEASAERLIREHRDYQEAALAEVCAARALRQRGLDELGGTELAELLNTQGSDSVGPKCEELGRMADALETALERRARVLEQSRQMHAQIGKANDWCRRGVELLSIAPLDLLSAGCSNNLAIYEHALTKLNDFLDEGDQLNMDALVKAASTVAKQKGTGKNVAGGNGNGAGAVDGLTILFRTTEASSLLAQVNERIDDIRRLSRARQDALRKLSAERRAQQQFGGNGGDGTANGGGGERRRGSHLSSGGGSRERPVQVVSPEKQPQQQQTDSNGNEKQQQQRQFSLESAHSRGGHKDRHHTMANGGNNGKCHTASSCSSSPTTPDECGAPQLVRAISSHSASAGCNCSPDTMANSMLMDSVGNGNGIGTRSSKVDFVLAELLGTERNYVKELTEILCHYVQPFEALEVNGSSQIPAAFRGQSDILFGNIRELHDFHHSLLLPALQQHSNSVDGVSAVLSAQRQRLLSLYRTYCRNKPMSEALRAEHGAEQSKFFMECQRRAGHLLPLSAYLLKPVQRITKYQLLLKELIRHCPDADQSHPMQTALAQMLDVLAQINADMEQLHILGYPGDLRLLGPLRLQTECSVFVYKRAKSASVASNAAGSAGAGAGNAMNSRRGGPKGKQQKRHLFLFDGGVLFCKKRVQAMQFASEYYEHKLCIPMQSLGFAECSRQNEDRFELWDIGAENVGYAIQPVEERARQKWIQRLARLTVLFSQQQQKIAEAEQQQRHLHSQVPPSQHQFDVVSAVKSSLALFPTPSPAAGNKTPRPQSWTTTSSSEDGAISSAPPGSIGAGVGPETGGSSTSVHSNRSSTSSTSSSSSCCSSSAVISEEKCQQHSGQGKLALGKNAIDVVVPSNATPQTAIFYLDQNTTELADQQSGNRKLDGEYQQQQQRSQSQPPLDTVDAR